MGETVLIKHTGRGNRYIPGCNLPGSEVADQRVFSGCLADNYAALEAYVLSLPHGAALRCALPDGSVAQLGSNNAVESLALIAKLRTGCWGAPGDTVLAQERSEESSAGRLGLLMAPGDIVRVRKDRAWRLTGGGVCLCDDQGNPFTEEMLKAAKRLRQLERECSPEQLELYRKVREQQGEGLAEAVLKVNATDAARYTVPPQPEAPAADPPAPPAPVRIPMGKRAGELAQDMKRLDAAPDAGLASAQPPAAAPSKAKAKG